MKFPRIAVVGAGNLSSKRIYPYIGTVGAELVGVCDKDMKKAQKNAKLFGGNVYKDMEEMIIKEKPDGVIICINAEFHAKLAPVVMKYGIPVYTEKPPALSSTDALKVAKVSKETGVLCTTAFKKRYNVSYNRAKEFIKQFSPDELGSLSIDYGFSQYPNNTQIKNFLFDFAIHMIDIALYLFGDIKEVFAFSKGLDAYAVSARYVNGAVGSFNFNCYRSNQVPTEEVEISIKGGNTMSIHNSSCWRIVTANRASEWREPSTFTSAGDSGYDTGHLAELEDFINAIKEGRKTTRSNIYESYKTMVFYEAIVESCNKNKLVELKYET